MTTTPDSDQADRQARRKHLADLILRMRRGELHPQGRDILAAVIKDEVADGDQARAQVAAVQAIAVVAATRHGHHRHALADALGWDRGIAWAKLLAEVGQRTRDLTTARAGDAPWIKAYGEDIEQGRAEARRNRDAWRNARQRAVERTAVLRGTRSNFERVQERVAEAEATLTAVRKQAADWARLAAPGDVGATPDDTAFAEAGHIILAALGDPQPATEAECPCGTGGVGDYEGPTRDCPVHGEQPAVCCVCGCPDVTYRNHREQPFCCRCAACCEPPVLCEHECQPPTEPEAEREPGWAPATCRRMDTRTCPPSGPCPGPCARFESDDPTPWEQTPEPATGAAVATDSAGTIFTLPGGIKPEREQPTEPQPHIIGVGMPALLHLEAFGREINDAFEHLPYLVGSAAVGKTWRDVDVRLILPDPEFDALFPQHTYPARHDGRWGLLCAALSELARVRTGLPVDFQIQCATFANDRYHGERHALGIHDRNGQ